MNKCVSCEASCCGCANDGFDLPQCKECGPDNDYAWYRPQDECLPKED